MSKVAALERASIDAIPVLPIRRLVSGQSDVPRPSKLKAAGAVIRFSMIVAIPTLLAAVYFFFLAAPQYVSETRFLVRSPQRASAGLFSGFLQSTGFVRAQDDSYAVTEFIKSRDAVTRLVNKHHLRDVLSRPEADLLTNFPPFWADNTSEAFFRHYLRFVTIQTDSSSGISTLGVRAFRAEDARNITLALLDEAEELVNRLNGRARLDAIQLAEKEIDAAEVLYASVQRQLMEFRNREAMIDPDKQAASILELVSRLSLDVVEKRARIYEIERQAPVSPQLPALKASISAIEEQIARERSRMVGSSSSLAPRLSIYESLLLQRELAARRVNSASTSLENAKLDAQRQQLYIERIVDPHLPDYATYPKSLLSVLMTFILAFSAFLITQASSRYLGDHLGR